MIYLFTALYAEAQCVIAHYKLKKDTAHTHFQLFENEELKIRLILTGAGNIAAACAVSGTFDGSCPQLFVIDEAGAEGSRMVDFCDRWGCRVRVCEEARIGG